MKATFTLALIAAAFVLTEVAAAETISCPLSTARREIQGSLPAPWFNTPIVNKLTETKVQTIAGKKHLACLYGPAGQVQREAPADHTCTAKTGGFDCKPIPSFSQSIPSKPKPGPASPVDVNAAAKAQVFTGKTGTLSVPQTYAFDLDSGAVGSSPNADLWFEAETSTKLFLTPQNGARIWVGNRSNRGREGCNAGTQYSSTRVPLSDVPVGSYVCAKTSQGKTSQFRISAVTGSPKTLTLGFTTFD
jgi:hypothetical protein